MLDEPEVAFGGVCELLDELEGVVLFEPDVDDCEPLPFAAACACGLNVTESEFELDPVEPVEPPEDCEPADWLEFVELVFPVDAVDPLPLPEPVELVEPEEPVEPLEPLLLVEPVELVLEELLPFDWLVDDVPWLGELEVGGKRVLIKLMGASK